MLAELPRDGFFDFVPLSCEVFPKLAEPRRKFSEDRPHIPSGVDFLWLDGGAQSLVVRNSCNARHLHS